MAEEGKKISFGFAKSLKRPVLKNTVPQEEKKVDYIECLDGKAIKVIGGEEKKEGPLVIPLLGSKTWHDRIINKTNIDIFEPKKSIDKNEELSIKIKEEPTSDISNGEIPPLKIKTEPLDDINSTTTLEEQAAKEIIEELNATEVKEETNTFTLPVTENQSLKGGELSTLEDYEQIPVDKFGLAMLRGMGWQPGRGIGKNEKLVPAVIPELRPKGMGLGADKITLQKQTNCNNKQEKELKIQKGTFVRIIAGKQNNNYGQIEGFDEDVGRLIVKMAFGGNTVSVNECLVEPVTQMEYNKKAKVLNATKYEEYKTKEASSNRVSETSESSSSDKEEDKDSHIEKHVKKETKKRKNTNSSDHSKAKKAKKSKKHAKQDSSPERSSKKHKKKDKEREKTKNKKSREWEILDRRKHKKHKRSRSRSPKRISRSKSPTRR